MPLEIAEAGAYVAEVADRLAWEGNPNLRGDALAAALLAEAGTRTAAALVHINAAGNGSDGRLERADELASKASEVALRAVEDDGS